MTIEKDPILSQYLTHVRNYVIPPTDGTRVISKEEEVFTGGIDGTYDNYEGTSYPAPPTKAKAVSLYDVSGNEELQKILKQLFPSAPSLKDASLTEHQVIMLIEEQQASLELDTYATFFVVEIKQDYYLHQVRNSSPGMPKVSASDCDLQEARCEEGFRRRLVLPNR
ncbi:MAG: hypothetical protein JWO00_110 [Candidatus Parcubacteria bacterium]|nr:hypothetical protein [Candidatus Parcubacteria bacterium]